MKTRKGFTMIELMVSIAIMLILTGAMTVSVVTYLQKTEVAKQKVQMHQDKFDIARAQVDGLLGSGGVVTTSTPTPTPTGAGGTLPTPSPTTVPPPPPPTAAATPTPTPSPTPTPGTPTLFPNANEAKIQKLNHDAPYEYSAILGVKSSYSYTTLWTIVVPEGTINVKYWYNCTIESIVGNTVTIKVDPWIGNPAIKVDYNGKKSFWEATVTNIVAK